MRLQIAVLILLTILILDASCTIVGINFILMQNQAGNFWTNPTDAAKFEGNPIAQMFIGAGLLYSAGLLVAWAFVIVLLYQKHSEFRFLLFSGIFIMHLFGYLSWLQIWQPVGFWTMAIFSAMAGIVLGLIIPKHWQEFLDRGIEIPIGR